MRSRTPAPPVDDVPEVIRGEELDATEGLDEGSSSARVCLACGASGTGRTECDHREVARFESANAAIRAAIARLRQAASERRQAERALRALVTSERARGRAELLIDDAPAPPPARPTAPSFAVVPPPPCPRCVERDRLDERRAAEQHEALMALARDAKRAPRRPRTAPAGQVPFAFAAPPDPPSTVPDNAATATDPAPQQPWEQTALPGTEPRAGAPGEAEVPARAVAAPGEAAVAGEVDRAATSTPADASAPPVPTTDEAASELSADAPPARTTPPERRARGRRPRGLPSSP